MVNVANLTNTTQGLGSSRAVAVESNDDYRVVWYDSRVNQIQTALFDPTGAALGSVQVVDSNANDSQETVAMDGQGDFIIAWQTVASGGANEVAVQRFNSSGNALGVSQIFGPTGVGTHTTGAAAQPAVAMDAQGDYAIAYTESGTLFSNGLIVEISSAATGNALTPVNLNNVTSCGQASLAMNASGNLVVAYQSGQGTSSTNIAAQTVNSSGAVTGALNVAGDGDDAQPSAAIDSRGDFVASYTQVISSTATQVLFQRYVNRADVQGSVVDGSNTSGVEAFQSSAAMDANGDFVVAYTLGGVYGGINPAAAGGNSLARAYDSQGNLSQSGIALANDNASIALTADDTLAAAFVEATAEFHNEFPFPGVFTRTFAQSEFTYSLQSNGVLVYGGYPSTLSVQIHRDPGFSGPISASFADPLPAGVTYQVSGDNPNASSETLTFTFNAPLNVATASVSTRLELVGGGVTLAPPVGIGASPSAVTGWSAPGPGRHLHRGVQEHHSNDQRFRAPQYANHSIRRRGGERTGLPGGRHDRRRLLTGDGPRQRAYRARSQFTAPAASRSSPP